MAGAKTKKVRFLQSPTGAPYMLAYSAGQIAELPGQLADQLMADGIAEERAASTRSTTTAEKTVEKATSKKQKTSTKR